MNMEPIVSSETSAIRTQTPGNYPKRNKLHLEHGESLKTRLIYICVCMFVCVRAGVLVCVCARVQWSNIYPFGTRTVLWVQSTECWDLNIAGLNCFQVL